MKNFIPTAEPGTSLTLFLQGGERTVGELWELPHQFTETELEPVWDAQLKLAEQLPAGVYTVCHLIHNAQHGISVDTQLLLPLNEAIMIGQLLVPRMLGTTPREHDSVLGKIAPIQLCTNGNPDLNERRWAWMIVDLLRPTAKTSRSQLNEGPLLIQAYLSDVDFLKTCFRPDLAEVVPT